MYRAAALSSLVFLAACQSPAQRQASDDAYCKSIGATGNMYAQCMMQREAIHAEDMNRRRAALVAGAQIMSQPQPRPMTTTTCRRMGQQVVCNSF